MSILNQLQTIIMLLTVFMLIIAMAVIGGLFIYKKQNKGKIREEGIDRMNGIYDSSDFLPIEDIRNGMIIDNGGTRFTAALICSGSDFYFDNIGEKIRKQSAYISFWHTLRDDICFRQSPEDIHLGHTIDKYREAYKKIESQLYSLDAEYQDRREAYTAAKRQGREVNPEYESMLVKMQEMQKHLTWRLEHINEEIALCESMSGNATENEKKQKTYIFSWQDPGGIRSLGLEGAELENRAARELDGIAIRMMHSLSSAGVVAKRASTAELIDLVRKVMHPYTGNLFAFGDMQEKTVEDGDIVTTDSYEKLRKEYRQEVADRMIYGQ